MADNRAEGLQSDIQSHFMALYFEATATPEDAHFASARAAELKEVSPYVLYREGANGQPVMEDAFVPGILRLLAETLPKTHTPEEQEAALYSMMRIVLPTTSPIDVLRGELGDEASREFLRGAIDALEFIITGQLRRTEQQGA